MKVIYEHGSDEVAKVYVAELGGRQIEFCESTPEPAGLAAKWVLIVSSLFGCPVRCRFCDAGVAYQGALSSEQILDQVRYLVRRRFGDAAPKTAKLKIQFARMGEPSLSPHVLDAMARLPETVRHDRVIACLSTIAPRGRDAFFDELAATRDRHYPGRFQLQFSIHSSDEKVRDWLMPVRKWSLEEIARYGERFCRSGEKKVTLNFAASREIPLDCDRLGALFDPAKFLIKLTPINPTQRAHENRLTVNDLDCLAGLETRFVHAGFETLLSIGNLEENGIGSNCGQYLSVAAEAEGLRALRGQSLYPSMQRVSP